VEVRASRRHRANQQQRRAGIASSSDVEEEKLRYAKREREPVCREDTDGDDEFKTARARCIGVSDGVV